MEYDGIIYLQTLELFQSENKSSLHEFHQKPTLPSSTACVRLYFGLLPPCGDCRKQLDKENDRISTVDKILTIIK